MARPEIVRLAQAVRGVSRHEIKRRGKGRYEGEVRALDPLAVYVADLDDELDDEDITIGRALERHLEVEPLQTGDTLVLIEAGDEGDEGDYTAVEVLPGDE